MLRLNRTVLPPAQLSATATIAGNEPLTYTWDFGDGTAPAQGQSLQHTYANCISACCLSMGNLVARYWASYWATRIGLPM